MGNERPNKKGEDKGNKVHDPCEGTKPGPGAGGRYLLDAAAPPANPYSISGQDRYCVADRFSESVASMQFVVVNALMASWQDPARMVGSTKTHVQ